MSLPIFHGDRPIYSEAEDRFGFFALADRMAVSLTSQAANKGFVFGLEGKWGSGKSSLLALTLARLREMDPAKVAAVEFRPWLIGDRDQLLSALFNDLAKAIANLEHASGDATGKTQLAAKEAAQQVKSFARHLGPIGKITAAAGIFVPGAAIAGELLEKIAAAATEHDSGPTLVEQKDKLSESLIKLSCRIVVAIDDVDRLEPKEVAELLRLVRSVADFPNVSYLLCYDARALERAIETGTGVSNGAAYLEKIIQTEVAVPRPESFALRRWFSNELQAFACCSTHRVTDLQHVIDETGGRVLDSPRAVVRVLDSLRVYWPSLEGRVDLADLVWLRMLAVGSPSLYRWVEEYLVNYVAMASGRAHVTEAERKTMAEQMDEALKADDLSWEKHQFEIERFIPGIQRRAFNADKDERLFSRLERPSQARDAKDKRLSSPSHSRIYFTLIEPTDGIGDSDIAELLAAARKGINDVTHVLLMMGRHKGDAGGTKAERLFDELRELDFETLLGWPTDAIVMGISNAADQLAEDRRDDDWGYPRAWYLARAAFRQIRAALPNERYEQEIVSAFESGTSLGFLTYLLRDETFGHGVYGDRPSRHDRLTSPELFDVIRKTMIARYESEGIDTVLETAWATEALYAWSQAGGRADLIELITKKSSDNAWLVKFCRKLYGPNSSLSLDGLSNFFHSPVAVIRRIYTLSKAIPACPGADDVIRSIKSNVHFDGSDFEPVLSSWEASERDNTTGVTGSTGAASPSPLPAV